MANTVRKTFFFISFTIIINK